MHVVPTRSATLLSPASSPGVVSPGLQVWAGSFPQDRLVQLRIRQQTLEPVVFDFQFLQTLGLINPHSTVFFPPSIIRRFRHALLPADGRHRLAPPSLHIGFPQFQDDLFGLVSLHSDLRVPFVVATRKSYHSGWHRLWGLGQPAVPGEIGRTVRMVARDPTADLELGGGKAGFSPPPAITDARRV
jgi:hypothetical protein